MTDHAGELRQWFGPHPATEAAIAEIARLRRDFEHLQAKAAGRDWWVSECAKSDEKCTELTLANQKLRAKVKALETAADAIIRFHNDPAEAKRPDVFHLLVLKLADAMDGLPQKSTDTKAAIESLEQLYSND
jgi:hypothetical protein